jgi:hypothetical protein
LGNINTGRNFMSNSTLNTWNIQKKTSIENRDTARHLAGQDSLNKNMIMPGASTCSISITKKSTQK